MPKQIKGEKHWAQEKGLTLLELVVSLALLSIALLSFANLLNSSLAAAVQAGRITQAAALAQERMETLLGCPFDELVAQGVDLNGTPILLDDFDSFQCYQNIAGDRLELGGYQIDGLRLEVGIVQEGGRELARFVTFVREEQR